MEQSTAIVLAAIVTAVVGPIAVILVTRWTRDRNSDGPPVRPPQEVDGPRKGTEDYFIYVVKQGDILFDIAQRYNTTMDVLQEINDLPNPNVIFPGQELKIPRGSPPGT